MPEDEKLMPVVQPEEEEKPPVDETPVVENKQDTVDEDIVEIVDKIQDNVAKLAELVAELAQMQASDADIAEEIQESLKGVVHEEITKSLTAFKTEIIKEITDALKMGIPEPDSYLEPKEPEIPEGPDKEEVVIDEKDLNALEPRKGAAATVKKGTEDDVDKRLKLVEMIMKGEVSPVEAKKMLRGV